jgi:hypothetical protein
MELSEFHLFDIFAIHPVELYRIENGS